ncbi:MAG: TonB-dependent receptor [Cytophagales bacterium]|nr:TonB-dependent receptor [Cytophagales bacterium]
MLRLRVYFAFLLITVCFSGRSQVIQSLSGLIIDVSSREPLPYATVSIEGTSLGTTSNMDGYFSFVSIPSDTCSLQIQYMGYETLTFPISEFLKLDRPVIQMKVSSQMLNEVVVTGSNLDRQMIKASGQLSRVSLSPKALAAIPSMGEQDIFRALQLLPGVSGTNEASSGLYVRGGTPDQNLILLDGFTVYHVDHFYGFFSAFNPNAIKDVQLYKGGFESKYGGRLSSVMELTGKSGNQTRLAGGLGIGAISANAYLEIPLGRKLNFFVAGRRSYTDIIKSSVYNNIFDLYNDANAQTTVPQNQNQGIQRRQGNRQTQQEVTEPSFFFYDLNSKLTFRPSDKDVVSLSVYNGVDDLDNSRTTSNSFERNNGDTINIASDIDDVLKWGNIGSSIRWARQWNDRYYSHVNIGYSNYFSDRNRLTSIEIGRSDTTILRSFGTVESNDLRDYSLAIGNEYILNQSHTLNFGTQITYNDISYQYNLNDTIQLIDNRNDGTLFTLYLQDSWKPQKDLTITGGLRGSYFDVTESTFFEPRLSASYELNDRVRLSGAWGHYYQFVNRIVREDVTQGSRDFWLLADDNQSPISFSRHLIGGIAYEIPNWLLNIEFFDKTLEGISEFSLRFTANPNNEGQFFFEGTGVARGLEVLLQKKDGNLKGWVSYTLSEVVHDIDGISDNPFYALHDSRHEINVVSTYELGKWIFGATWVYGTGKPYTAPYGEYQITTLDGTDYEFISVGAKNAFRLPDYHRLDLSVNYKIRLGQGEGNIGLSLFNFYDRTNIWYKEFLIEEEEVIETGVNLIGLTPNLNLSIKF